MRPTLFRTPVLVLVLGTAAAFGGPVGQDETATPPTVLPESQDLSAADPAASAAAAAAKILEEAQAGATPEDAHATPRRKQAAHPAASAAGPAASAAASAAAASAPNAKPSARRPDEPPWRKAAKAAVEWIKDVVPGLRSADDDADPPSRPPEEVNWDATGLQGGARGSGLAGSNLGGAGVSGQPGVDMPSLQAEPTNEVQRLLRDAMEVIGMVIGHPMSWLVIALFVIGGYVMGKADRRPK